MFIINADLFLYSHSTGQEVHENEEQKNTCTIKFNICILFWQQM